MSSTRGFPWLLGKKGRSRAAVGLQSGPPAIIEAAHNDGANGWRRFRTIRLPLIKRTLVLVLIPSVAG